MAESNDDRPSASTDDDLSTIVAQAGATAVRAAHSPSSVPTVPLPEGAGCFSRNGHGSPRFAPHKIIASRYEVVRFIGRGGMGEVYEANDRTLGGQVALKAILPEIAADTRANQRFMREIQLARRVTHANVCRIFDAAGADKTFRATPPQTPRTSLRPGTP